MEDEKVEIGEILFGAKDHKAQLARVIDALCDEIKNHVTSILQADKEKPKVSKEFLRKWTGFIFKANTKSMMQSEYIVREILKELGLEMEE